MGVLRAGFAVGAMGAQLLATEPVFAATVAAAEPLIARESGFSVTEAMTAPQIVTGIDRIQPTLFTMQVALAATMKAYGVRPGAVIGHSLGEAAAAVVAGALSLEDGVRVICRRSRLMSTIAGAGAMASVELPAQQVVSELMTRGINDAVVAVVPSPQSTVIGGATQTVRDLVAAWEQRDVMAREIAVDVASHSPQVDPILDELTDVLAELHPMTPEVPFYSATLYDPRERPVCDAGYWADNLRHMVRFAPAVQAALEDGYRVFAELAPHPLLTHAVEQTARSLDMPLAALAGMRREQALPYGLRGFVADLHSAGAAVDFSVLYPNGRLVDAPLPTWTHRRLLLSRDGQESPTHGGCTVSVHPLLGAHVRLQEEPERHVWQGEVGTAAQPWLGDHRIRNVAMLPGAAYCEMALAAARAVLGEASEVRDIRFEQVLLLDEQTTVGASASLSSPGVVDFTVETKPGGRTSAASYRSPTCRRGGAATCAGHVRAACRASALRGWRRGAQAHGPAWCSVRSGVHRSGRRAHRRGGNQHRAGRGRATPPNPLATRCLRCAPRTAGCLFSVRGGSSGGPGPGRRCAGVAVGYPSTPLLPGCPHRPLLLHTGDESRYFRGRGRPRRARRARGCPAHRAGPATGHRQHPAAATTIGCWPSGC